MLLTILKIVIVSIFVGFTIINWYKWKNPEKFNLSPSETIRARNFAIGGVVGVILSILVLVPFVGRGITTLNSVFIILIVLAFIYVAYIVSNFFYQALSPVNCPLGYHATISGNLDREVGCWNGELLDPCKGFAKTGENWQFQQGGTAPSGSPIVDPSLGTCALCPAGFNWEGKSCVKTCGIGQVCDNTSGFCSTCPTGSKMVGNSCINDKCPTQTGSHDLSLLRNTVYDKLFGPGCIDCDKRAGRPGLFPVAYTVSPNPAGGYGRSYCVDPSVGAPTVIDGQAGTLYVDYANNQDKPDYGVLCRLPSGDGSQVVSSYDGKTNTCYWYAGRDYHKYFPRTFVYKSNKYGGQYVGRCPKDYPKFNSLYNDNDPKSKPCGKLLGPDVADFEEGPYPTQSPGIPIPKDIPYRTPAHNRFNLQVPTKPYYLTGVVDKFMTIPSSQILYVKPTPTTTKCVAPPSQVSKNWARACPLQPSFLEFIGNAISRKPNTKPTCSSNSDCHEKNEVCSNGYCVCAKVIN